MVANRLESLGHTLIIVNPVAQSGAAANAAERLQRFLALYSHRDSFNLAQTQYPGHATEIALTASNYDTVLALGGDGVVHEVACGLMQLEPAQRPSLGVVPVGSGNDFARTLGLTEITDVHGNNFGALLSCKPATVDVLKVTYEVAPVCKNAGNLHKSKFFARRARKQNAQQTTQPILKTSPQVTYAIETFSFGLDAAIAIDTEVLRASTHLSGTALYTASGLRSFGKGYRSFPVRVRLDNNEALDMQSIVFAVQNGPTYGSGYHICPQADPSDGLLDICYAVGPVPRTIALPVFLSAKNGKHVDNKHIRITRAKRVELEFPEDNYPIQVDGERLHATKLCIEVVPQALRVLRAP